jgi:hypothetical protein
MIDIETIIENVWAIVLGFIILSIAAKVIISCIREVMED